MDASAATSISMFIICFIGIGFITGWRSALIGVSFIISFIVIGCSIELFWKWIGLR